MPYFQSITDTALIFNLHVLEIQIVKICCSRLNCFPVNYHLPQHRIHQCFIAVSASKMLRRSAVLLVFMLCCLSLGVYAGFDRRNNAPKISVVLNYQSSANLRSPSKDNSGWSLQDWLICWGWSILADIFQIALSLFLVLFAICSSQD